LASLSAGCAQVHVKDGEWCGDAGEDGASCFHTLTEETRDVEKKQWDEERLGMLCTRSENFANWKTAIEQLCNKMKGLCTYETREMLQDFFNRVEKVKRAQDAKALQRL
jgi:predicted phage-related endonuclease